MAFIVPSTITSVSLLHTSTLIGVLALSVNMSWPLLHGRKRILTVQALGSSLFALHYLLIGAETGAVMCAAAIVQSVTGALVRQRTMRLGIVGMTLVAGVTMTFLTWQGLPSAFAQATGIFSAAGRLQPNTRRLRWLFVGSVLCSLIHNFLVGSLWGLGSDMVSATILAVRIWRD